VDLGLQGQVAVVAGGGRGIGLAIAREFAREKASVAIVDRDPNTAATAQAVQSEFGVPCQGLITDVTDFAAVQAAATRISEELGPVDHVVFAVAIGSGKFGFPFWNLTPADWPRVMEVNVQGAVHVAHAFVPVLLTRGAGTLTFLASVAGQIGSQTDPPYSASKAALINFMQCAARDLAPHGIRVNALAPGMVKTDLNRSVWEAWSHQQPEHQRRGYEEWAEDKIRRVVPLGRWQEAEDVAAMVVFLASQRGKNITGQTLNVDGGFVIR
jgi:NAD(P)-dependent dehydrogenase (short-subunit alcohol dehydrogenase family)